MGDISYEIQGTAVAGQPVYNILRHEKIVNKDGSVTTITDLIGSVSDIDQAGPIIQRSQRRDLARA